MLNKKVVVSKKGKHYLKRGIIIDSETYQHGTRTMFKVKLNNGETTKLKFHEIRISEGKINNGWNINSKRSS